MGLAEKGIAELVAAAARRAGADLIQAGKPRMPASSWPAATPASWPNSATCSPTASAASWRSRRTMSRTWRKPVSASSRTRCSRRAMHAHAVVCLRWPTTRAFASIICAARPGCIRPATPAPTATARPTTPNCCANWTACRPNERGAFFICVLVLLQHADDPSPLIAEGRWYGHVLTEQRGTQRFRLRPIVPAGRPGRQRRRTGASAEKPHQPPRPGADPVACTPERTAPLTHVLDRTTAGAVRPHAVVREEVPLLRFQLARPA